MQTICEAYINHWKSTGQLHRGHYLALQSSKGSRPAFSVAPTSAPYCALTCLGDVHAFREEVPRACRGCMLRQNPLGGACEFLRKGGGKADAKEESHGQTAKGKVSGASFGASSGIAGARSSRSSSACVRSMWRMVSNCSGGACRSSCLRVRSAGGRRPRSRAPAWGHEGSAGGVVGAQVQEKSPLRLAWNRAS